MQRSKATRKNEQYEALPGPCDDDDEFSIDRTPRKKNPSGKVSELDEKDFVKVFGKDKTVAHTFGHCVLLKLTEYMRSGGGYGFIGCLIRRGLLQIHLWSTEMLASRNIQGEGLNMARKPRYEGG